MKVIGYLLVLQAMFVCNLNAQLCTGSLGDAVMNITFGGGSNPGPQIAAGQTGYTYSGRSCPNEGEYSLLNLTFSCFNNTWQTLTGDHTPDDVGGYYMLVNSASASNFLFTNTFNALCPNTTYEFATWIKNALRPGACNGNSVSPNLLFTVETLSGIILSSYKTGSIEANDDNTWKQYGMLFKTTASITDVVLRIKNEAPPGCGNALAIDDITISPCGPALNAKLVTNGLTNIAVCETGNASFVLSSVYSTEYKNPVFQWQTLEIGSIWNDIDGANAKDFVHTISNAGFYTYRMLIKENNGIAGAKCSYASNTITINIRKAPFVQATNYVYGCLGGDVSLFASGAGKFVWTGPNGYTSNEQGPVLANVKYTDGGVYKVTGTTDIGCKNSDSTILRVYPNATATSGQGTFICEGASTTLIAGGGVRYLWQPAGSLSNDTVANPIASPIENTVYRVKVTNQYGCSDTAQIKINVWKKPQADAGPDLKTRVGLPTTLKGTAKGTDVNWYWTPTSYLSANQLINPIANPPQTITYRLNVVSQHGCGISTDDVIVKVYEKILIPNAFSPNGDGINDTWFIDPLYLFEEASVEVYNRYGQVVYRSRGYNTSWDGTNNKRPLPAGTYYYLIDLKINKEPKLMGSITIFK